MLRTTYPGFIAAVNVYFDKLIPKVVPFQVLFFLKQVLINILRVIFDVGLIWCQFKKGGPIIAVQVENKYGSHARDGNYMSFIKEVPHEWTFETRMSCVFSILIHFLPGSPRKRHQWSSPNIRWPWGSKIWWRPRRYKQNITNSKVICCNTKFGVSIFKWSFKKIQFKTHDQSLQYIRYTHCRKLTSKQRPGNVGISFKQKLLFIESSLCVAAVIQVQLRLGYIVVYTHLGNSV